MLRGFNTDIELNSQKFHIQTEDWGVDNPHLVTQIYKNGAMVRRIKIPYNQVLPNGPASSLSSIRLAMELQHKKILDLLVAGKLFKLKE